ncbi:MAG TPA: hypothetical protein PKL30_10245 [Leptospiraceae bacterium]|nr:hypothetical protein [Leptospiraceae bacterium]HMW07097.1 hypothetical protein [Leptospiraceae bacterium]HMX31771.1 hypothetical protein [Leptospiraceae bacterium]HMY32586.1 hypothetical protein [Leptospiraceae bacterium]HMZ63880.1 hypothetical protein [Leptospiraceae bacterium]
MEKELSFQYNTIDSVIVKIILSIIGFIFFIVGLILVFLGLASIGTEGNLLDVLKFIIPGITIFLFISTAYLYSMISKKRKIVSAYFDLESNRFYMLTKSGESGYIPFGEISSFDMRREVVSGSESSTTYYVVFFIKKDGAWWDIVHFDTELAARKKLNLLQDIIKLDSAEDYNLLDEEKKSKAFLFSETSNGSLFKWKENVSMLYRVIGLLAVISFLFTFGIIVSITNEEGSIGRYVVAVFISIFGIAVLFGLYKSIFGYSEYELAIGLEKVSFFGVKKDKRKLLAEMFIKDIQYSQYTFNMLRNDLFNGQEIYILNSEFAEKIEKYKKGDLGIGEVIGFLKDVMQMQKNIIKLPFPGFMSLDIILFEKKLDEELRKRNPDLK